MAKEETKLPFLHFRCTTVNSCPSLTKEGSWIVRTSLCWDCVVGVKYLQLRNCWWKTPIMAKEETKLPFLHLRWTTRESCSARTKEGSGAVRISVSGDGDDAGKYLQLRGCCGKTEIMAGERTRLPFLRLRCTTVNSFPSLSEEGSWVVRRSLCWDCVVGVKYLQLRNCWWKTPIMAKEETKLPFLHLR